MLQSDIYRSDFLEERKDRERAQGALHALQKEMENREGALDALRKEMENRDAVFKEELAIYREQNKSSKATIQTLISKVEEISFERDNYAQQSKKAMEESIKVETQVI